MLTAPTGRGAAKVDGEHKAGGRVPILTSSDLSKVVAIALIPTRRRTIAFKFPKFTLPTRKTVSSLIYSLFRKRRHANVSTDN